jgi:hypothetical protein
VTGSFVGNATFYSANPVDKKITLTSGSEEAIFLAKYTPAGALLWVQTGISNCGPDSDCTSYGVAANSAAGTVYIAIATQGGTQRSRRLMVRVTIFLATIIRT